MAMTPIGPDDLDRVKPPRAYMGGYNVEATDDLLRRASWQLRQILHAHAELAAESKRCAQELLELEAEAADLRAKLEEHEQRQDLIGTTLTAAQRTARAARAETRSECELMIAKARKRAKKVVASVDKERARLNREVRVLEELRDGAREEVRAVLSAALANLDALPSEGVALEHDLAERVTASAAASSRHHSERAETSGELTGLKL